MGSDTTPQEIFQGVQAALQEGVSFFLYSKEIILEKPGLEWVLVEDTVEMDDSLLTSLRHKKQSSLYRALTDLKEQKIDACLSCGNTAALVGLAKKILTPKNGTDRPALLATLPTLQGPTYVVDVGGNTTLNESFLYQHALLGVEHLQRLGILRPKVALLNIGTESSKGTKTHQHLYKRLEETKGPFQFLGNIEGKDVFSGKIDLVVTDGFTGNVFLKTAEGATRFLIEGLKSQLTDKENLFLEPHYQKFAACFSQDGYPAAYLLGVLECVIKCHGKTTTPSIKNALLELIRFNR